MESVSSHIVLATLFVLRVVDDWFLGPCWGVKKWLQLHSRVIAKVEWNSERIAFKFCPDSQWCFDSPETVNDKRRAQYVWFSEWSFGYRRLVDDYMMIAGFVKHLYISWFLSRPIGSFETNFRPRAEKLSFYLKLVVSRTPNCYIEGGIPRGDEPWPLWRV